MDTPREYDEFETNLVKDLETLIGIGLVEIVGIDKNGDWLYGITEQGRKILEGVDVDNVDDFTEAFDRFLKDAEGEDL